MVKNLDGTKNEWCWCKQNLGANAILAVSLAVCKAGATVKKIPLYQHIANIDGNKNLLLHVPAFNLINGGSHAGNKFAMQDFLIFPTGASSFKEAMKMGVEVYHNLKAIIAKKYGEDATNLGDVGGFAPNIQENKKVLDLLNTAVAKAGYTARVFIGMDVDEIGEKVQVVGDDLQVNQIESLTKIIEAVRKLKKANLSGMICLSSGETEDTFIADLTVGLSTGQIKTGAPCRPTKCNQGVIIAGRKTSLKVTVPCISDSVNIRII